MGEVTGSRRYSSGLLANGRPPSVLPGEWPLTDPEADLMTSRSRSKLPIGIQTFRTIREGGYYYVDKTPFAGRLVDEGTHYFLSRPRRFGKSLFLDTLGELFEGSEVLFRGLDIHDKWDWSVRNPVLRLSFSGGNFKDPGALHASLMAQLDSVERRSGVASRYDTGPERFAALVEALRRKAGRPVAVLVDAGDYKSDMAALNHLGHIAHHSLSLLKGAELRPLATCDGKSYHVFRDGSQLIEIGRNR